MAQRSTVALAVVLLGCGHTEPFTPVDQGTEQPFNPTPPVRLTLNLGADRSPAWLADGSGIVYSTQSLARPDGDLCLAVLPPAGGRQRQLWCDVPGDTGTADAIESPAPGPDGRLLYVAGTGPVGARNPSFEAVALAPTFDPTNARNVRTLPYTPDGGAQVNGTGQFRWLDGNRIVYLGQQVAYRTLCFGCPLDTIVTGRSVNLFQVDQPGSIPAAVPGTELASGVAPAPGGDAILYTISGSSLVFRRTLSTGQTDSVFDFGAAGIARDIHVSGNRLVGVVGGRVAFSTDPELGPVQWDSGGVIHVVDLVSGSDVALDDPGHLYRHPALSPAGDRIVVEGYGVIVSGTPGAADTAVSRASDIYLIGAP
jgi:hypothetical protein